VYLLFVYTAITVVEKAELRSFVDYVYVILEGDRFCVVCIVRTHEHDCKRHVAD